MAIRRFSADDVRQVRRVRPHQYPIERLKLKVKTLRQSVSCLDWKCLLHELERQIHSATPKKQTNSSWHSKIWVGNYWNKLCARKDVVSQKEMFSNHHFPGGVLNCRFFCFLSKPRPAFWGLWLRSWVGKWDWSSYWGAQTFTKTMARRWYEQGSGAYDGQVFSGYKKNRVGCCKEQRKWRST